MDLIIDIGNSFYKFYLFKTDKLVEVYKTKELDESLFFLKNKTEISNAIVSSVKSNSDVVYNTVIKNFNTIVFDSNLKLPIKIDYNTPNTLGNDRIANACGASTIFPDNNTLVIDAGTAITYDIIENGNVFIGGNISPGINIRYKALNNFTDRLPLLKINSFYNKIIGKSTEEAIYGGVQNGVIYEVKAYIADLKKKYSNLKTIFTGGDAFFFDNLIKNDIFAEKYLSVFGLKKILEFNKK